MDADDDDPEESVVFSEVSLFQQLKFMQGWYLGWERCLV